MRGVLTPDAVYKRTIEDRFMQRLELWPIDRHIDENVVREWIGSISSQVTQMLLLSMLDKGILRMEGFRYFRR